MNKSMWVFIAVLSVVIAGGLAYRHFAQDLDSRGATRLMRALEENDVEEMEDLLQKENVNVRDKSGQTALFYAARHAQQPQIIHKLILAGADPLATDKYGYTPLMAAAASNANPVIVKVLARQGGKSPAQQHNKDQALKIAAQHNALPVIKMLLIAHASPAVQDEQGRQAADYLAENTQLTDPEKTDLRQVMLTLEILEGREHFFAGQAGKQHSKPATAPAPQPAATKKPIEKKMTDLSAEKTTAKADKPTEKTEIKPASKAVEKEITAKGVAVGDKKESALKPAETN